MSYQALYRTYRPQNFKEVVGQEFIVKTLENAITQDKISHAYLFSGPRGTGKTSIAKIFAKTINCENSKVACGVCKSCLEFKNNSHPDVIELDAASNNSVDDIRELIDKVAYAPVLSKYKVYIIDEVHMLSNSAFNALLKTLEEPPSNVIFILATTDPQKVIPTVLSRVQRYNFSRVSESEIFSRLKYVLEQEKIEYDEESISLISRLADGGLRDALSILDQCLVYGDNKLNKENVYHSYGILTPEKRLELIKAIDNSDLKLCLEYKEKYLNSGIDLKKLILDLLKIYKEIYIYKQTINKKLLKTIKIEDIFEIEDNKLLKNIELIIDILTKINSSNEIAQYFELLLMKLCQTKDHKIKTPQQEDLAYEKVIVDLDNQESVDLEAEIKKEAISNDSQEIEEGELKQDFVENSVSEEIDEEKISFDKYILSILNSATREEKAKDNEIFKKIEDYKYNSDYRNVYLMLENAEIIASSKDAIVVVSDEKNNINDFLFNRSIYSFLLEILELDKMIFAIKEEEKNYYFDLFRRNRGHINYLKIERHQLNRPKKIQDKLSDLFGDYLEIKE